MIEKLELPSSARLVCGKDYDLAFKYIKQTVNQLVDAVNELQEMCKSCDNQIGILAEQIAKLQHDNSEKTNCQENVQDKFAEQRKWIGKLCKFWDDEDEGYVYEILIDIEDDGSDYPYKMTDVDSENWTMSYKHCEPVSEDLIYKGGNNE